MTAQYETFGLQHDSGIAALELNRPRKGNSVTATFCREFEQFVESLAGWRDVKVLLISAEGNVFSVGGDIDEFYSNSADIEALLEDMTGHLHAAISLLSRISLPVIAVVNGVAAGGGLGLVAAADYVIASESARFVSAYTRSGLTPDTAVSYYLPRLIGQRRAAEMILFNRMLSAQEALDWGLVNRVVPAEALNSVARKFAGELVDGSAMACGVAKALINRSFQNDLDQQMADEASAMIRAGASADGKEGVSAFLQKRKPKFGNPQVWIETCKKGSL
jgi:2-(1,2-epoxy-1,2-dihydrophenyl)acetyl-CoA isomerase